MSLSNPSTPFEVCAVRYIRHQQTLGKRFNRERWVIGLMARFLAQQGACELDAAQFEAWCHARSYTSPNSRRGENLILRKFCLYRQRTEAECFVPDPLYFPRRVPAVRPVILGSEEIARLLEVIEAQPVRAQHPLRRPALRIAVILLYTAGLRCGELARLRLEDIDLKNRTLWIQATKFHKTRIVPLSPSAARELRDYLKVRLEAPWDISRGAGLFGHHHGAERFRPYSPASIGNALRSVLRAAKVCDPLGKMARVHDLRHSFAVQALLRWYRAGLDVQSKLAQLSTYMGHGSIGSTAYYLNFVPELAMAAHRRFERHLGSVAKGGAR